jgi:hypothetical protein
MHNTISYLLVDIIKGSYPLVMCPYSKDSASSRETALMIVMEDLHGKLNWIIEKFNESDVWNFDLQCDLQENGFSYNEDEDEGLH